MEAGLPNADQREYLITITCTVIEFVGGVSLWVHIVIIYYRAADSSPYNVRSPVTVDVFQIPKVKRRGGTQYQYRRVQRNVVYYLHLHKHFFAVSIIWTCADIVLKIENRRANNSKKDHFTVEKHVGRLYSLTIERNAKSVTFHIANTRRFLVRKLFFRGNINYVSHDIIKVLREWWRWFCNIYSTF